MRRDITSNCFSLLIASTTFLIPINTKAQIAPDGTTSTTVNQDGNDFVIDEGDRVGDNLFHSFSEFSVPTGGSAGFNNAGDIANIFSRVTGSRISNIDGLLSANGTANLYLINPNGIIFGENARLDLGGSFFASTADSLLFEGDAEFSASNPQAAPLLEVSIPIGASFRNNPGDITVRGDGNGARTIESEIVDTQDALRVAEDTTIGLIGGNLNFESATVKTAGGRIEVGSVAGGRVGLVEVDNGFSFDYSEIEAFQDISLSGRSNIDASGNGGGDINIAGRNIFLTGVSAIVSNTLGDEVGGDTNVFATDAIEISGVENEGNFVSAIVNRTSPSGTADAGDINIETNSLSIGDRAFLNTSSSGQANAGNIIISASDSVSLASQGNDSAILSSVDSNGIGNAGNITIDATNSIRLEGQENGATIVSSNFNENSDRNAGNIAITTNSFDADNGNLLASHSGRGNAGNISISTIENIFLNNDSRINVAGADGNTGNIDITSNYLTIENSRTALFAGSTGLGTGGNITIDVTNEVSLANNSGISVTGSPGGSVDINTKNLSLLSGSLLFAGASLNSEVSDLASGDVVINLSEDLVLDGSNSDNSTNISNSNFGQGNSGNVEVNARNITFNNGASISSITTNQGNVGNVTLNASGDISFDGINGFRISGVSNSVGEGASGSTGDVNITAKNFNLTNGAGINSRVSGTGDSGNINLNIADTTTVDGFGSGQNEEISGDLPSQIFSNVDFTGIGNSGDIKINTQNLFLARSASIDSDIFGRGNAGNIEITADTITLDGAGLPTLGASEISSKALSELADNSDAEANAGNLIFKTNSLSIANGASLSVFNVTTGNGNGGSIQINATENVSIDGETIFLNEGEEDTRPSGIFASVATSETIGRGGSIEINTPQLSITNRAEVNAFTRGQGDAGAITINVDQLSLADGQINTLSDGRGNAGNLTINANEFVRVSDRNGLVRAGSLVDSTGDGGNLTIRTGQLSVLDGAQVITATLGQGDAGNLIISAGESIELSGTSDGDGRSGLFAGALAEDGNGGNLQISTGDLIIRDDATINVSNIPSSTSSFEPGTGEAGNLTVEANSLSIENNGRIDAATQAGNGGNITLNIAENISLRNTGLISARALRDANGGNININTDFIVGFPQGNNDIIANASEGRGGNINIDTQAIFGLEERPLNPLTNDINASSEATGLDGTVDINNPAADPTTGLINLPASVGDASDQISQNPCQQGVGSEFKITGKGGLPPTVNEAFNSESAQVGLIEPVPSERKGDGITREQEEAANQTDIPTNEAVPAMGWVFNDEGEVTLTAYSTTDTQEVRSPTEKSSSCSAP